MKITYSKSEEEDLTIEEAKEFECCKDLTDEEIKELLETIRIFTEIAFCAFANNKKNDQDLSYNNAA